MILIYLLLFITVLVSGSLIFLVKTDDKRIIKIMLAFSGAFLIGISFLKLIPEVFSSPAKFTGLFIILGFLLQLILELITEGAEHGHRHVHSENEKVSPFLLLIGLCIHGFLEGAPISENFNRDVQHSLIVGIVIHNIPISLTLMGLFLHYGLTKRTAFSYLVIFALMTPLGSFLCHIIPFASEVSLKLFFNSVMAVVVGIFLHVSTSILFETSENHKYNLQKFITVVIGLGVAFIISIF